RPFSTNSSPMGRHGMDAASMSVSSTGSERYLSCRPSGPGLGQQGAIEAGDAAAQTPARAPPAAPGAPPLAPPPPAGPAGGPPGEAVGHRIDVARLDEDPVDAVAHHIRNAADLRRDDRPAAGERFDRAHGRSLVGRGQDERVEGGVVRRDLVLIAEKEAVP